MKRPARPWIGLAVILVVAAVILGIMFARGGFRRGSASREVPVEAIARARRSRSRSRPPASSSRSTSWRSSRRPRDRSCSMPVEVGSARAGRRPARADRHGRRAEPIRAGARRRAGGAGEGGHLEGRRRSGPTTSSTRRSSPPTSMRPPPSTTRTRRRRWSRRAPISTSARQRRDDATVRAPIAGTVLEQLVSAGQVISSATSSVSGGTSLLKMADLSRIRLRALVSETDIGERPRRARRPPSPWRRFPQRTFRGRRSRRSSRRPSCSSRSRCSPS